jgi:hypothetical protein
MQEMAFELSEQQHEALNDAKAAYDAFLQKQNKRNSKPLLSRLQEAEGILPSGLTDALGTLPTTDNVVIVDNLFPQSAPDTDKWAIRFPELFLSQYACAEESTKPLFYETIDNTASLSSEAQGLHHDNEQLDGKSSWKYRNLLILTGISLGTKPNATRVLSLSTALQNPTFTNILNIYFDSETLKAKDFEGILRKVGDEKYRPFTNSIYYNDNYSDAIDKALSNAGLYLLTPGKGVFLNNATLLHGRASAEVTALHFPDQNGEGMRILCRHQFAFAESAHPLLQARQAAQSLLSR